MQLFLNSGEDLFSYLSIVVHKNIFFIKLIPYVGKKGKQKVEFFYFLFLPCALCLHLSWIKIISYQY